MWYIQYVNMLRYVLHLYYGRNAPSELGELGEKEYKTKCVRMLEKHFGGCMFAHTNAHATVLNTCKYF